MSDLTVPTGPVNETTIELPFATSTRSPSVARLFEALAKAQGLFKAAVRDNENPFFKAKYADLSSVWEASRVALSENGLCVIQTPESRGGDMYLRTTLAHKSGEWFDGVLPILAQKRDPQGIGSAMTYARRYALSAIIGATAEDDDGEAATERAPQKDKPASKPLPAKGKTTPPPATFKVLEKPSEAQLKRLYALATAHHWPHPDLKTFIQMNFQTSDGVAKETSKELSLLEYNQLCAFIMNNPYPKPEPTTEELAADEMERLSRLPDSESKTKLAAPEPALH